MGSWASAALSLVVALLGMGCFLAALEVGESSLPHDQREWRLPAPAMRDELGRPTCRRNNFADPARPLTRIGPNCGHGSL